MDKQIIPIFIDSSYSEEVFYEYVMYYQMSFHFTIFISSASIDGLNSFCNCIIYLYIY